MQIASPNWNHIDQVYCDSGWDLDMSTSAGQSNSERKQFLKIIKMLPCNEISSLFICKSSSSLLYIKREQTTLYTLVTILGTLTLVIVSPTRLWYAPGILPTHQHNAGDQPAVADVEVYPFASVVVAYPHEKMPESNYFDPDLWHSNPKNIAPRSLFIKLSIARWNQKPTIQNKVYVFKHILSVIHNNQFLL